MTARREGGRLADRFEDRLDAPARPGTSGDHSRRGPVGHASVPLTLPPAPPAGACDPSPPAVPGPSRAWG